MSKLVENGDASYPESLEEFLARRLDQDREIVAPINEDNIQIILGNKKGIEWYQNSCYIDSTLFSIFAFNSAFDDILDCEIPPNHPNLNDAKSLQIQLRHFVVNPLRRGEEVSARYISSIREILGKWKPGFISGQMEPQEFLDTVLRDVFRFNQVLELGNGCGTDFFHNILMDNPPPTFPKEMYAPTVQQVLENSLKLQEVHFIRRPAPFPVLMLPLPLSFDVDKPFTGIIPSMSIDISGFIKGNEAFKCSICSKQATCECNSECKCGNSGQYFCDDCFKSKHQLESEINAKQPITYKLHLSAIICAIPESRHFVSFVRCCPKPTADWVYFDSFDPINFFEPVVTRLNGFGKSLKMLEDDPALIKTYLKPGANQYTKRILKNPYMYFYVEN